MIEKKRYSSKTIAEELTGQIVDRKLPIGKRIDSTPELAERYGVSEKTIHRVMRSLVAGGLVRRVPGSGSFVNCNVRFSQRLSIGIFFFSYFREMPELHDLAFDRMNRKISEVLKAEGHSVEVLYQPVPEHKEDEKRLLYAFNKFDIVVMASGYLEFAAGVVRQCGAKVILILDDTLRPGNWHQILFDYRPGFEQALQFLMEKNCYRIFVAGLDVPTSLHRFDALRDAARVVGFPVEQLHLALGKQHSLDMPIYGGRDCARQYLENFTGFPPIISLSDFLTIGMVDVFSEHGIPLEKLTIVSYDNIICRLTNGRKYNHFSAITHPLDELPMQVLYMVEDIARRDENIYKVRIIPASEFVVRS